VKLVSILVVRDDSEVVDAHLSFHLNAGVDLVLAIDAASEGDTSEVLESYARTGHVHVVPTADGVDRRSDIARLAVAEHGADWVLSADADEFWWPRGESLKDVVAAIPPRYEVVQGLVRVFPPRSGDEPFAERMTTRPSLHHATDLREPLPWALRPLHRAGPRLVVDPKGGSSSGRRIPLRAWYPIEVLRFPFRSLAQAERRFRDGLEPRSTLEAEALEALRRGGLAQWYDERAAADGEGLVEDTRLRDALRALRAGSRPLLLKVPDIVDDASYAGECAAVGEVDLETLERQIVELEGRITWLEERFWPRVLRQLSRLVPGRNRQATG
jgi:Glycosyl transferase family 2